MSFYVEMPPVPVGSQEEQLRILYRYLYNLAEQLNIVLRELQVEAKKGEEDRAASYEAQMLLRAELTQTSAALRREIKGLKTEAEA